MPHNDALPIDVVSDVVCPWCYIGKKRIEQALALAPDVPVELTFRPFFLNPSVPLPFQLDESNLSETVRLTHRVVDLRREAMQKNLMLRYRAVEARKGKVPLAERELTKTDRNGRLAGMVAPLANWATETGNKLTRPAMRSASMSCTIGCVERRVYFTATPG